MQKSKEDKIKIPTILLIEGRPIVQEALKLFLVSDMDMNVQTAKSYKEAIPILKKTTSNHDTKSNKIDLILFDVVWAKGESLEMVQSIKKDFPSIPILVMSTGYDDKLATRVLKLGASGYKSCLASIEQFQEGLLTVLSGRTYISPLVTKQVFADSFQQADMTAHEVLSDREFQILIMIALGKTVGEIGLDLQLSVKTISTYRTRVLEKLNLKNNSQIMQYSVKNSLI
ncbi:MAG: response regulator transcription factor [Ignavibacteria bacterium]|nr:response regulator transcription factor [Ignavibacteria bacterium]